MRTTAAPTSPASIRSILHPPAAAPAAGGWGIDGSRRVHSVGSRGLAAGGAEEEMASAESFLGAEFLSSAWGAPVECCGGSAAPGASAARRCCDATLPLAGVRGLAAPAFVFLEGDVAGDRDGVVVWRAGWRCLDAEERRLPGRDGKPPSPSVWRCSGGFRRRSRLLDGVEARAQEGLIVIFFVNRAFL